MSWMLAEYVCNHCGVRFESLEERPAPRLLPHHCEDPGPPLAGVAEMVISAPKVGTVWATAASMGKSDPPPTSRHLDTRDLGDGMSMTEFREKRRNIWREHDHRRAKDALG